MPGIGAFVIVVLALVASAFKVVREYERLVVFRLGRLVGPRGPGLTLVIPGVEKAVRVDLRTVTMDVPAQDVITKDNVSIKVNAVLYFRVVEPNRAVTDVENYLFASSQNAQTTLRSVCGRSARRSPGRTRQDQRAAPDDHRPAHRAVGHQGRAGRDQAHRPAGGDAPRDGAPGRGGARAPREGDRRGGRVPGGAAARRGGVDHGPRADHDPASLPADARGDRDREQLDDDLPGADGSAPSVAGAPAHDPAA